VPKVGNCCDSANTETIDLDDRETIILAALIRDGSAAGASDTLNLSERQIRRLLRRLEARLGVANTHALIAITVAAGLVAAPHAQATSQEAPLRRGARSIG
jgi:DNA-binding CsgD family transcriptional regulator